MSFQDLGSKKGRSSMPINNNNNNKKTPSQEIAASIFQINTAVSGFRRLVDSLGTAKDTPDHRRKLHHTRQRILEQVKHTSANLKALSDSDHDSRVHASKRVEDAKLAKDFQTVLLDFQKAQRLASERESTFSPPTLPPPSSSTSASHDTALDQDAAQPFLQNRQEILFVDNEIAFNEAIIDERDMGIREIEEQIGQTNEIFKDLAVLVHEQGVVIDDIHSNIENSAAATTQARVQLGRASKSVKSRTSWCWWILAIFVVAVIVFLVVILV